MSEAAQHVGTAHLWVDDEGYLRSPTGAKLAQITCGGALRLFDKRCRMPFEISADDLLALIAIWQNREFIN